MRDEKGRFLKGTSGNPEGRPRGSKNRYTYLKRAINRNLISLEQWDAILKQIVEDAKRGDHQARKFLAELVMGKPKDVHKYLMQQEEDDVIITLQFPEEENYGNNQ